MPLAHIRCVVDRSEETPAGCVACAEALTAPKGRRCQFTASILRGMYDSSGRADAGVSATSLTGCPRQTVLQALYPYTADPERLWPAFRGTLGHDLVQRHPDPGCTVEVRYRRRYGPKPGEWLTGQMDEVDPRMRLVRDYKTGSKPPDPDDVRLGGFKESWVWQLNLYRWILAAGERMDTGEPVRLDVTRLGIVYLHADAVYKYTVPVLPLPEVEAFVLKTAPTIQYALDRKRDYDGIEDAHGRELAMDSVPWPEPAYNPQRDKICVDWCPSRDRCLTRPAVSSR